ncbi:MAG: thioredoxin domain-containing protein [Kofleriaceae bacterium]|nr:thioredoxin domain-containing protein [Kofleriaceae bacterium]
MLIVRHVRGFVNRRDLESRPIINYNAGVRTLLKNVTKLLAVCFVTSAMVAGCKKDPKNDKTAADIVTAADRVGSNGSANNTPVDTSPLPGIDVSGSSAEKTNLFFRLIGSLTSPCGKAHSLRTSFQTDQTCKRATFAVKYVQALIVDGATEPLIREQYDNKYKLGPQAKLTLDPMFAVGPTDAPVTLVEFFDYGCPACQQFFLEVEKLIVSRGSQVVVYYKMFPLEKIHPDSKFAAQAAVAAAAQGKFKEMHQLLFTKQAHSKNDVFNNAKGLGLDMAKFAVDYDAAVAKISADQAEGDTAGVTGTPAVFFNGYEYKGPRMSAYLERWIDEDIAVNR